MNLPEETALKNDKGVLGVQLALTGALFTDGQPDEQTSRLLAALGSYRQLAGDSLRWLKNPQSSGWAPFTADALDQHRTWIEQLGPDAPWELAVSGGKAWNDASEFYGGALRTAGALRRRGTRSYFRFALPAAWLQADSFDAVAFLTRMATIIDGESGWLGFGLVFSPDRTIEASFRQTEYATARRFEGIDVGSVAITSTKMSRGIKGVNWLTVLGQRWVDELGGREGLGSALESLAQVHDYEGGVIIQAGPQPVLADKNRGESADAYRSVGQVLAPVRTKVHGRFHKLEGEALFNEETTLEWLGRFDE